MMQGFRKAGQTWLGRIVVAVLFGLLILSFAVWGIGDMIHGVGAQHVAKVGSTEIGVQAFREAYQNEIQGISRRIRRTLTGDEARQLGLDRRVLDKLVSDAALDARVKQYGLAISDETIAKAVLDDPNFKGSDGRFSRAMFDEILRANGFSEKSFLTGQRNVYLRGQIAEALAGAPGVPGSLIDAVNRYRAETREVVAFTLGAEAAGTIPAPTEAELASFFDGRKAEFRAPEYRKATVLALTPASVADPKAVAEADIRAAYDRIKATRLTSPERRAVRQMVLNDAEKAKTAAEKLAAGNAFDAVAAELGMKESDVDLGLVTRREIVDAVAAEAAFSATVGTAVGPVAGRFGQVFVLVTAIEPERVVSYEEAAPVLAAEIARTRAVDKVRELHDKIEDQRASARSLADIAKEAGLTLAAVEIDRTGRDKAGAPGRVPEPTALVPGIFASDVGVDNEAIATRDGGWIWFSVDGIEGARERTLAETRAQVEAVWTAEKTADLVSAKAADAVRRIAGGEDFKNVAASLGANVITASGMVRTAAPEGLSPAAVSQIFLTPVDKVAAALGKRQDERVVFKVVKAETPAIDAEAAKALAKDLELALGDDIVNIYVSESKKELGVALNPAGLRLALGAGAE